VKAKTRMNKARVDSVEPRIRPSLFDIYIILKFSIINYQFSMNFQLFNYLIP
jgi:hypothetical protein